MLCSTLRHSWPTDGSYCILSLQDTDKAAWEAMFENPPALLTEVTQFYTRKCTYTVAGVDLGEGTGMCTPS